MSRRLSWLAALEGLLFLVPFVYGVGIAGILQRHPDPRVGRAMVLLATAGWLLVRVGVPVCLFLDAGTVRKGAGGGPIARRTCSWDSCSRRRSPG